FPLGEMLRQTGGVYGWSALSAAAFRGDAEMIRILLDAGANPNRQDEDEDNYPLHWARDPRAAQALVGCGADISVLNRSRLTPLELAKKEENAGVVAVLQVWSANRSYLFEHGYRPHCSSRCHLPSGVMPRKYVLMLWHKLRHHRRQQNILDHPGSPHLSRRLYRPREGRSRRHIQPLKGLPV
ncbi:MAG: hypothetical protein SGPRY_006935, partial [Prymnesium sp.]